MTSPCILTSRSHFTQRNKLQSPSPGEENKETGTQEGSYSADTHGYRAVRPTPDTPGFRTPRNSVGTRTGWRCLVFSTLAWANNVSANCGGCCRGAVMIHRQTDVEGLAGLQSRNTGEMASFLSMNDEKPGIVHFAAPHIFH